MLSSSIIYLAILGCSVGTSVVAASSQSVCTTQPKATISPGLRCGKQGLLTKPALIDDIPSATFSTCRDSCRPYNAVPCVSFAYNAASSSCRRFSKRLVDQGFSKKSTDGYLYYATRCFAYRIPLTDAGFEDGSFDAWKLHPIQAQAPAQANRSIVAPGFDNSAYAALIQTTGTRDNAVVAEMYKFFGPLCPGEQRALTFAYFQDSASYGTASLVFVLYTSTSQALVSPQRINFQYGSQDSLGNPAGQWNVVSYPFTVPAKLGETMYVSLAQIVQGSDSYLGLLLDDFQTPLVTVEDQ